MKKLKQVCTSTVFLAFFFLMGGDGIAQLAIGQWRDHLSYKKGISVTQSTDKIFCATESGIFSLEKYGYTIERLSKITGLSDVGVSTIRYNDFDKTLLIAYKNANIDLVIDKKIYNVPDIKRYVITAKKTINNIYLKNGLAYLACGFGIVVLDMDKKEIKDTYYIGTNAGFINIRDITSDASYLYAATDSGVFRASLNAPNLADYNSWNKLAGLPKGIYNSIAVLNGKVYTNNSGFLATGSWVSDTIYAFDGTTWTKPIPNSVYGNSLLRKMEVFNNQLVIAFAGGVDFYDSTGTFKNRIYSGVDNGHPMVPMQAIVDMGNPKVTWFADYINGVVKNYDTWGGTNYFAPMGPNTSEVYSMSVSNQDLWVARGNHSDTWGGVYNEAEAYKFSNESWSSFTKNEIPALDTMRDIVSVAIDPSNKDHVYLGTLGQGLVELNSGALVNVWNEANTNNALQSTCVGNFHWVGIYGLTFDQNGNLWISNSGTANPLVVRKADGTWQSFSFSGMTPNCITNGSLIVNQYNQKWMVLPRQNGLFVYDENGTWGVNDDKKIHLSFPACVANTSGNSADLPTDALCLAEDKSGDIWLGTDKGIAVFYCPDQVFASGGCKAQQIFIQQDGHTQILLATEIVTAIAVDGANRKWIGTQNSGVYLMSADGTTQIRHFTVDNSPLLSNEISSIVINAKTGEVFFGTLSGIIAFRNDATEGLQDFTDVYAFPNPVQPGYDGPIAITGLIENANVKITDIASTLVYQTKALGGQAIWYGRNFKGEKVSSGVYLVFCSNDDGTKTFITKILLIN